MRNTLRFLLANLADFDPDHHTMPSEDWLEIDRYSVALANQLQNEIQAHYGVYEFQPAVARILTFCSEDLGGFYLDILKDRLYTMAPNSTGRRSAQNALFHITRNLLKWLAPFLSFTAEEAWGCFPHGQSNKAKASIFMEEFGAFPSISQSEELISKWNRVREIRSEITKAIELEREAGNIGSSLQAELSITADKSDFDLLNSLGEDLHFVTITSSAKIQLNNTRLQIDVRSSKLRKCGRCWHHTMDAGEDAQHPDLCKRCISNLFGKGEYRLFA